MFRHCFLGFVLQICELTLYIIHEVFAHNLLLLPHDQQILAKPSLVMFPRISTGGYGCQVTVKKDLDEEEPPALNVQTSVQVYHIFGFGIGAAIDANIIAICVTNRCFYMITCMIDI